MNRFIIIPSIIFTILMSCHVHASDNDTSGKFVGKSPAPAKVGMLLPAVQSAPEARAKSSQQQKKLQRRSNQKPKLSSGNNQQHAADVSCNGVNSCNDMIATCIALGGNVTQTGYDGATGAPNSATCYSPGKN